MFFETMKAESKRIWIPGPMIIGAGPSGLAVAACLKQKNVPFLVVEKENCLASLWKLKTYDSLKLHLTKQFCQLPYMELPQEFPAYPTKEQFISYLEAYAKHFCIEPRYGAEVQWAKYDPTMGFWRVRAGESEFFCRWLIVATGENAEPVFPIIDGIKDFEGRLLHTSMYKNGVDFIGSRVLVVGCGNSGMEIGLDLCNNGAQVSLVVRDKLHILPREIFGRSTFSLSMWLLKWFPVKFVDRFILLCSRILLGDTQRIGIKRPEIGPLELKNTRGITPVLDVGAMDKIKSGDIKIVPGVRRFSSNSAEFMNGRVEEFESVILATGYKCTVPSWLKEEDFLDKKKCCPKTWKGKKGVYSVGFTKQGIVGASRDAERVAEDVAAQWKCETKNVRLQLLHPSESTH